MDRMRHRIPVAALALLLLVGSTAMAHQGHPAAHSETVQAGPYTLTVEHSVWPIRAKTNVDLVILPAGPGAGLSGYIKLIPPPGSTIVPRPHPLVSHASLPGALTMYNYSIPAAGQWVLEFDLDGAQGRFTGRSQPFAVTGPPGLPLWAGWLMGYAPLLAIAIFLWRERRRVLAAMARDGGARA